MRVISYLMSGPAHLHYLVPSLVTLRNHWNGPIEVWAYPESFDLVKRIAQDKRLMILPKAWNPAYTGKNSQFLNKIHLLQIEGPTTRLYLDADTTIHGGLNELFEAAENFEVAATQFNNWTTKGGVIQNRLRRLQDFPRIDQIAVSYVLENECPSPNGGIIAAQPKAPVLKTWFEYAWEARNIFICDEAVLHILPACFSPSQMTILLGGKYNCSHKYKPKNLSEVVIYHYHGDSNVRPDKSPKAVSLWGKLYRKCLQQGYGYIDKWHTQVSNRWLDKIKEQLIHGAYDLDEGDGMAETDGSGRDDDSHRHESARLPLS